MTTATATTHDRFLTVPQLIERWPVGRTVVYQLINGPDFPALNAAVSVLTSAERPHLGPTLS